MAWMQHLDSLCSGCGNPTAESMSQEMDGAYEAVPLHCFACAARDAEQRKVNEARSAETHGPSSFDGLLIGVQKRHEH